MTTGIPGTPKRKSLFRLSPARSPIDARYCVAVAWSSGRVYTCYWSSFDTYEGCPQRFLWSRGWGAIDVGGGPGRKKPVPYRRSEHHAVLGIVIGAVLEDFYNEELWRHRDGLQERLEAILDKQFKLQLAKKYIDYNQAGSREEMRQVIYDGVFNYIGKTLKAHKLLGPYARSEVDLVGYVNKYTPVGGRADFIIKRPEDGPLPGITILDGKNSRRYKDPKKKGSMMTYTNPDQLRWYAMCFYLAYQQLPDRLGFVYFRYPHGDPVLDADGKETGETETGVDWVDFTKEDLKGLAARAVEVRKGMDREKFPANPSPTGCKFCDYESVCPERTAQKAANRRTPKKPLDELDGAEGFVRLGWGGAFGSKSE